ECLESGPCNYFITILKKPPKRVCNTLFQRLFYVYFMISWLFIIPLPASSMHGDLYGEGDELFLTKALPGNPGSIWSRMDSHGKNADCLLYPARKAPCFSLQTILLRP